MSATPTPDEIRRLVGQSIMLRFDGPVFTDEAQAVFREIRPGGVIFFADNITSRRQVHALTSELQAEARSLEMPPLLIGADQEGGIVSRLPAEMVTPPGPMALTATGDVLAMERSARITARQLREVGINLDFAPVVDVNNNPENPVIRTRSFGDTVEKVVTGALATIEGLTRERVISCAKHFPGHGDTNVDSHLGLPVIEHTLDRLHKVELAPFKAAIAAGVPGVMTTHIIFPELDEHPATLSHRILIGLLRDELGFDGVIFTDSLSMDAIDDRYGLGDAAIRCKAAGVDVLESNESLDKQLVRFRALVEAAKEGSLALDLFTSSLDRLNRVRRTFGLGNPTPPLEPSDPDLRAEAEEIAARTIVQWGDQPFEPLRPDDAALVIDFQRLRSSEAEDPFNRGGIIRDGIRNRMPRSRVATISHQPEGHEVIQATQLSPEVRTLVVLTRDATDFPYQVEIARRAMANLPPGAWVVHVALRGPYDAGILGPVDATLLTFGDPSVTLRALAQVLTGQITPTRRVPVPVGSMTAEAP
jgi:beta-N-acetylhexosaminidase